MVLSLDYQLVASAFTNIGYTLRFEITGGILLLLIWILGQTAARRQKPKHSKQIPKEFDVPFIPKVQHRTLARDDTTQTSAHEFAHPDTADLTKLRDASLVVPQLIHLCRSQALRTALTLYQAAMKAGLEIQAIPEADCQQLFIAMVTSTIRTNQMDEAKQLLQDLHNSVGIPSGLLSSVVKLCTSKQLFRDCLAFYDSAAQSRHVDIVDKTIWSCLLFCAIESRDFSRCYQFFNRLKECGTPSQKDFGNMVRLASLNGDWQLSAKLLQDMREASIEIDCVIYNTCLNTCVAASQMDQARLILEEMERSTGVVDAITYNTLMKGYAKAGQMEPCLMLFDSLQSRNIQPTQVTYGIVLDGLINDNQLDRAAKVFNAMSEQGISMNTILHTTLIKGFARVGEVDQAMQVYAKMRGENGMPPDLITFSILIKAHCDIDRVDGALELLEEMLKLGLRPDEVVFNNLLGGCVRLSNTELGNRLYSDMVSSGVRPSNATFSILIRLYQQCKLLEDAVELLKSEPVKHRVSPEPRLFLQLIQSCIRERQGRRALEVYKMMFDYGTPQASTNSNIVSTCMKLNMYETASDILAILVEKGGRMDHGELSKLLEVSVRKRKLQVAQSIAASMEKLGYCVDPSFRC